MHSKHNSGRYQIEWGQRQQSRYFTCRNAAAKHGASDLEVWRTSVTSEQEAVRRATTCIYRGLWQRLANRMQSSYELNSYCYNYIQIHQSEWIQLDWNKRCACKQGIASAESKSWIPYILNDLARRTSPGKGGWLLTQLSPTIQLSPQNKSLLA